nr:NADP-dependent malic enzyme [bacterium]
MDIKTQALEAHKKWAGKLRFEAACPVTTREELSLAYTPGVAEPCREIARDEALAYTYTRKWNTVAVITDGTAVLGLGDIGPKAALPVMEGKCVLFKAFAGIDAMPLCLDTKDPDEIVSIVRAVAPGLGGINLEDISAPRCFEIERRLVEALDIPVFHDDQHGTAVVVLAGMMNAARVTGKKLSDMRVVVCGMGAAGSACARILLEAGIGDITAVDRVGILSQDTPGLDEDRRALVAKTNHAGISGGLEQAMRGADAFVGVSGPGVLKPEWVKTMHSGAIVFAMANPVAEIEPGLAREAGAAVVGTGRSDFPNQINNVLAFPGIFRGALDVRASRITAGMKVAAARTLASLVDENQLGPDCVIPSPFLPGIGQAVGQAVAQAAREDGVAKG